MTTREQRIEKYHADRSVYQAVPKSESLSRTAKDRKLCTSLEEAIKRSLKRWYDCFISSCFSGRRFCGEYGDE